MKRKKLHLVGPYYANISRCRVHRMSKSLAGSTECQRVYRLREFPSEYFRTGTRKTVTNHGIIRPTVQLHVDIPFWGVGICTSVTVACLIFQKFLLSSHRARSCNTQKASFCRVIPSQLRYSATRAKR
jgi:hypothetical protein